MKNTRQKLIPTLAFFAFVAAPGLLSAQEPTKEALIETLSTAFELLDAGKFAESQQHFLIPENFDGDFSKAAAGFIKRREISREGIQILSDSATFGPAITIFGDERAKWLTDRMNVDARDAWGFYHETEEATGEVLAVWKDGEFKICRLDDVGKLQPANDSENTEELIKEALQLESNREYAKSWVNLAKAHEQGNRSQQLKEAFDRLMGRFANAGIFIVGRNQQSLLKLMGKPHQIVDLGRKRNRWIYGSWGIDFHADSLHGVIDLRGATEALFSPTEKLSIDLPGDNWSTQFREKRKGQVIAYMYTEKYTRTWKEQFTVERYLDVASITADEFSKRQFQSLQKQNSDAKQKLLAKDESSVIYAEEIPLTREKTSLHRLTRIFEGPKDIHKITYTIRSAEAPTMETQLKWLEIFKNACLETVGKQDE